MDNAFFLGTIRTLPASHHAWYCWLIFLSRSTDMEKCFVNHRIFKAILRILACLISMILIGNFETTHFYRYWLILDKLKSTQSNCNDTVMSHCKILKCIYYIIIIHLILLINTYKSTIKRQGLARP